ncbi:MAG: bifunctional phosphoglucose/phosphomannose isomerase [Chloroflexota bacterium]|nr:bifunctional phosphoglucose/phosphomannose isomerase [Chloroflexota bacterium]
MSVLDDPTAYQRIDPQGMLAAIRDLPRQCRAAWQEASALGGHLPADYLDIDKVVILGMGGSAIAGDLLRSLVALESPVPIFSHRSYELPLLVDERTLLIASSYSGGTEEVLSAFERALPIPAKKLVITTGGRLLATARANGVPAFVFAYEGEPRAALGYSIMPLLRIAEKVGLVGDKAEDVEEAIAVMEGLAERIGESVPAAENPAKQLAHKLHDRLPVIYGAGILTEVAHRWKTQLNESSKVWCFYEELPEANHNAIIGYALPQAIAAQAFVVFLRSPAIHPRILLRYDFTRSALAEAGVESAVVEAEGKSPLAQMMSAILFGDYISLYLAILNGVAPAPTTVIDHLKEWLAAQQA